MNSAALLGLLLITASTLSAQPLVLQSTDKTTLLLELYTSEGCSSCPPAETWLSTLKKDAGLWTEFVPVAFHVDYWDYLGWRDPFAKKAYSDRQRAYAASWNSRSIYTPGFVAQGTEWKTWGGVLPKAAPNKAGILKASLDGGSFTISYDQSGDWEVHLVPLGFDQKIAIQAGENAGRTLQHDFVALSHEVIPAKSFPVILKSSATDSAKAVTIWISRSGENAPVQAVGGWLK
jgi:hypothetical protein